ALVVAGYLGSLGLTSDRHRGWRSVLRPASRIAAGAFSRGASFAPMATSSRGASAARRRVFHPSWLTVTFGLSSRHRNLRRSASRVGARPWLTATELAQCARCPHRSTSAWFACPPFTIVVAPRALTTRSTRTPTGGASRLGGRRLPWLRQGHGA